MGYSPFKKGHKVLNLNNFQISVSRDVVFHEHSFPFHESDLSSLISSVFSFPSHTNISSDFETDDIPFVATETLTPQSQDADVSPGN